jgi:Asp/Glu/hydantoin racemase
MKANGFDPVELFSMYMKVTGVPSLADPPCDDPRLRGKTLGIVDGSTWINLWSSYFGSRLLPGVKLINVGNGAVQLNFMRAHHGGEPCPPAENIERFVSYARDLVQLHGVDAVLISCSTMNRAAGAVREAMATHNVPVVQIDEAMMEQAVQRGGTVLVVATHGPTVKSTQALLDETASRLGGKVDVVGATVEQAFELLGEGRIREHNDVIADAIRGATAKHDITTVVLAQLSMTVFVLTYPESKATFGVPVLTSGETGFQRAGEVLRGLG